MSTSRPVEAPAAQQAPVAGENKLVLHNCSRGHEDVCAPIHWGTNILAREAVSRTPPPGSPDQLPFPTRGVPQRRVARSSCSWRPPSPPTIPVTCTGMFHPIPGTCPPVARFATGKSHHSSPVPVSRTRSRPRGRNRRSQKQALQQGFNSRYPGLGQRCRHRCLRSRQ